MYSVALATYNGEQFLRSQLLSIAGQTIPPAEIVIGDDASSDRTIEIAERFAREYSTIRWRIIRNGTNLGFVKNFETVIAACSESYVFLSDQDDYWVEDKAEKLLNILQSGHGKVVFSNALLTDSSLNSLEKTMFGLTGFDPGDDTAWNSKRMLGKFISGNIVTGATMAFERNYVLKMFPVPRSEHFIHDSWIAALAKLDGQLAYSNECLTHYRQHQKNAIGVPGDEPCEKVKITCAILVGDMQRKRSREQELIAFLSSRKTFPIPEKMLNFLQKRQKLYEKITNRRKNAFSRLAALSPALYFQKLPNFETAGLFVRNGIIYILGRR